MSDVETAVRADSVLLVGFGGPTPGCCKQHDPCPGEAYCFVHDILGKSPAREKRAREVAHHYQVCGGGFSPYTPLTLEQAKNLEAALAARGHALPVVVGQRHWTPYVPEAIARLAGQGKKRALCVIMAPHQSTVSWDWYIKNVGEALDARPELGIDVVGYVDPWWTHPGFVGACADRIRESAKGWTPERFAQASLVFTAHAIPAPVERTAPYARQFKETAALVAKELGHPEHVCAYQSQPGDSSIPWSKPAINDVIHEVAKKGSKDVIVAPIGFLVDHMEVLFDLDVEARDEAQKAGIAFHRAGTVASHPKFIAMLADLISAQLA